MSRKIKANKRGAKHETKRRQKLWGCNTQLDSENNKIRKIIDKDRLCLKIVCPFLHGKRRLDQDKKNKDKKEVKSKINI